VLCTSEGEKHLEMTSSPDDGPCRFEEIPGRGPQLAAFGAFDDVLYFTEAEANM
jgi:hypothetical protein